MSVCMSNIIADSATLISGVTWEEIWKCLLIGRLGNFPKRWPFWGIDHDFEKQRIGRDRRQGNKFPEGKMKLWMGLVYCARWGWEPLAVEVNVANWNHDWIIKDKKCKKKKKGNTCFLKHVAANIEYKIQSIWTKLISWGLIIVSSPRLYSLGIWPFYFLPVEFF